MDVLRYGQYFAVKIVPTCILSSTILDEVTIYLLAMHFEIPKWPPLLAAILNFAAISDFVSVLIFVICQHE